MLIVKIKRFFYYSEDLRLNFVTILRYISLIKKLNMKFTKLILLVVTISCFINCNNKVTTSSDAHPNFKIGKKGFEKSLQKEFDFDKLSIGTYITKKNGVSEEKGLSLTFQKSDLHRVTDSIIIANCDDIKTHVKKYLLNIDNYEYVIIKFEEEIEGDISKSTSIKVKKQL